MKKLIKDLLFDLLGIFKIVWFFILFFLVIYFIYHVFQSLNQKRSMGPGDPSFYSTGDDPIKEEQRYER